MAGIWTELLNLVIRPQRCKYEPQVMLGPKMFMLGNRIYERRDMQLTNPRGMKLECSHYMPIESQRPADKLPCVVYLHGNCGSRCDALESVQALLPYNITVFALDFAGSGLSEGQYVSLGYFEQEDVISVLKYLRTKEARTSRVGLWGRSMGAATALTVASRDITLAGIVVDSPFTTLVELILDLVKKYAKWVPEAIVKVGIGGMRKSIQKRAKFDLRRNDPIERAKNCQSPVMFGAAFDDDFIKMEHSERIMEVYGGPKDIIRFDGDHNSERPDFFYETVSMFFNNVLIAADEDLLAELNVPLHEKDLGGKYSRDRPRHSLVLSDSEEEEEGEDDVRGRSTPRTFRKRRAPRSPQIVFEGSLRHDAERDVRLAMILSLQDAIDKCEDPDEKVAMELRLSDLQEMGGGDLDD